MSADNGIYIAQFPDGFRVIHAQAIENLYEYEEGSNDWEEMIDDYYGRSDIYTSIESARVKAFEMAKDCYVLEYGIQELGYFNYIPKNRR